MKPPKIAWMPIASIRKADRQNSASMMREHASCSSARRARPSGRAGAAACAPTKIMKSAIGDAAADRRVRATPAPPPKVASTIASTHQEAASSNAPAVSDSVPSDVLARPRSLMIRASIGKAVSAMQAPRNSVALRGLMPAANRPGTVSSNGVSATASTNGATMPASDTLDALFAPALEMVGAERPCRPGTCTARRRAARRHRARCASPWGRAPAAVSGKSSPSSDGPSTTPAIISPTTCGWPSTLRRASRRAGSRARSPRAGAKK